MGGLGWGFVQGKKIPVPQGSAANIPNHITPS